MTLLAVLRSFYQQHGVAKAIVPRTGWLAYSGGLDSHVLLDLCYRMLPPFFDRLRVIHIDHGLNPRAQAWSLHCRTVCAAYGLELVERQIHLDLKPGESVEEVAREQRYAVFAECMESGDMLLTAHHEDDQAETVLLQLLRGAGPKGLAAMPVLHPFAKGHHGRPLLNVSRQALYDYAIDQHLKWIEDDANTNLKFTRNFIRHEILPLLKSRSPNVTKTISRSAQHCGEAQALLEEFATSELASLKGTRDQTLSVKKLMQLNDAQQRLILRTWISQRGHLLPNTSKLYAIQKEVLAAAWDKLPVVTWSGAELRRYRDDLYLMPPLLSRGTQQHFIWDLSQPLQCANLGMLHARQVMHEGLRADLPPVTVRFRKAGESVYLPGRQKHCLKNLLQEWGMPPWERSQVPLLFYEDQLICVLKYFIAKEYLAGQGNAGFQLSWVPITG